MPKLPRIAKKWTRGILNPRPQHSNLSGLMLFIISYIKGLQQQHYYNESKNKKGEAAADTC
jgi:hypothetical protein